MTLRERVVLDANYRLTMELEREVARALDRAIPGWSWDDVAKRCAFVRRVGEQTETLQIDGEAVLEVGPIESEFVRGLANYTVTYSRSIRHLK